MIKYLALISLVGCATAKTTIPPSAKIKDKTFASTKEARHFVRNKWNYLYLLFEQSHDPYYGTPKWPADCLIKNKIGKIEEKNGNTFIRTQLILNETNEPGYCEGKISDVIWLQCGEESNVKEIICPSGVCNQLLDGNPCLN